MDTNTISRTRAHRPGSRIIAAVITALIAFFVPASPALAFDEVFDSGHIDAFYVTAPDGQLHLSMQEDVTGSHVQRPGDDVLLQVVESAWSDATEGVPEIGESTYFLPQTQDPNIIWPGWDTQPARDGGFTSVDFEFTNISGPGSVYVFETSGFGNVGAVTNSGSMELTSGEVINQPSPAHRHVNWAFSEAGTYEMTVQASSNGQTSNAVTYTWQVGEGGGAGSAHRSAGGAGDANNSGNDAGHGNSEGGQGGNAANDGQSTDPECRPGIIPQIKDDTASPPQWRDADGATFYLSDNSGVELPEDVGPVSAGQAWMIGSTQVDGVPWLGANTQSPSMREHIPGDVTWELVDMKGPGAMMVYSQGGLGKIVGDEWFRGANGAVEGSYNIAPNTHVHPNWVFEKQGTYDVTIRQVAQTSAGKQVAGQATLHFVVGGGRPEGSFDNGHFDLGAEVTPDGGDCGVGAAAGAGSNGSGAGQDGTSGSGANASGKGGNAALANTGTPTMPLGIGVLGLGMLFLGLGIARLAVARAKN
ncbi:choice-of-anchor M domain-containing protein [Corynebacterium rhinophilum]|uniref:choice-of-anchor M domain-containing protein n=1 Tax=Corynebacterium rhinophilum TaxID=3050197 RepID=UPI00254D6887|nr:MULTISPECIES: choice-of-anchor M domain-containing protein [unclassified Corynebacterium]MDK8702575.1 choice-of-anchor M domain-containing protein [Corynebacterium sp. MSK107]MDK8704684.1 choice-of-anchor M domain-containing protein [Corynebacterium sp. MSK090]